MKTILFVGSYPNKVEPVKNCFFQTLIYAIADMGYRCIVITPISVTHYRDKTKYIPHSKIEKTPKGKMVKIYFPRYISYSSKTIGNLKTMRLTEKSFQRAVLNIIRKYNIQFDASYGHFFLCGGLAAVKAGKKYNKPSFVAFGEDSYEECVSIPYGNLVEKDLDGISGIVAVSTKNKRVLSEITLFNQIPILVAPNGVDSSIMIRRNKKECRRILNIPEREFIVGFVGSFEERKGDKRLYEAVKELDNTYVAFAGKGSKYTGEKVVFCDAVSREMIPVFLNSLDAFCLPTLSEGCSNAIVEALACGLPIISSDCSFNDDILDKYNSIRINPLDINEIREAIKELRDNKEKCNALAKAAAETSKLLTIEKRAENIIDFMKNECV